MKKRKISFNFIFQILYLCTFVFCIVWFFVMQYTLPSDQRAENHYVETFNDDWYLVEADGSRTPFQIPGTLDTAPGNTVILEKTLSDPFPSDMWLCFKTSEQDVSVYVDGSLRASFSTKDTRPFGISSPSAYFFVNMDTSDAGKTISVEYTGDSIYSGIFRDILYGDKTGIIFNLFEEDLVVFLLAIVVLALGCLSMIVSFFLQYKMKTPVPLAYLSWCAIAVSAWILSQSSFRQFIFPNISVTAHFSDFVLLLLPIPFAIYFNTLQKWRYLYIYRTIELVTFANFLLSVFLITTNRVEASHLEYNIYTLSAITIFAMLGTSFWDIQKRRGWNYRFVIMGTLALIISAILQILQALSVREVVSGNILCFGFIILLSMASAQAIIDAMTSETEHKQALYANEAKANFLASMSHEIRTPINAVLGIDEMILSESNEDKIRDYAKDIQTAGRTLLALINDILDFSKIESGKMNIVPLEYDLASVINDSCNMIRAKADEKKLIFHTLCDPHLPSRLLGDEVRIRQIFTNLLSNAVKYTSLGSITFSVSGTYTEDKFILEATVRDTGIGIREESIPYLFDSFSRVDNDVTHKIEGSGLGLSIVKNLIDLMQGEIIVESEFGKGTTFTVRIPQKILSETPIGAFAGDFSTEDLPSTEDDFIAPSAKILAVDDVAMNLKVFCGLLKDTLISIDTATSGKSCLAKIRSNNYDMIFLDHMMPEMDGIETLRGIEAIDPNIPHKTPIIMLTANAILGAKEEYLRQGFTDYLSKPIQKDRLLALIKQYLPADLLMHKDKSRSGDHIFSLEKIAFLNTEIGLSYHAGDKDFYLEIIKAYEEDNRLAPLQNYYDEEDWHNYRILVHSLSSSSKIIGATELSNMAKQLENAAKVNSTDYIKAHHVELMGAYQALLSSIRTFLLGDSGGVELPVLKNSFHILVVDDDKINLKTARKILKNHYQVSCLETGQETLSFLEEQLPDMILLDVHMPDMDGFEVLKIIKANERTKNIPVVFLTADTDYETELSGFKAGASDFIRKPFIPDIMLERLTRIIENDRIQQSLQSEIDRSNTKVENLSLQAMMTLAQTIDAKDKYTKGHSTRVASYAKQLAKYLNLPETEQENIYFMGLLHDIGKIGVPDYIITKSQKLTPEEYSIIKKHTTTGYDILKNFGEIPNIEQGARWHHERVDGSGYPDGLKGDEIPMPVRIISVADAYDAMTSKRNYRNILPREYIREELERGKGAQFDPMVAQAMLDLMDEITFDIID